MSEEKKFAILQSLSVQRCAEACGIEDLPQDVAAALAEDASYRIREVVNTCTQFMKHSRRTKLTSRDVSKALKLHDIPPTLGEDHSEPPQYEYAEEGDFHYLKDDIVNLREVACEKQDVSEAKSLSAKSEWLLLNGQLCSENMQESGVEIPNTSMEYYTYIVTCVLGEDKELQTEALADLSKNSKIATLIPYFVNFVSNVNAVSHDLEQLSNLLQTVSALLKNPYLEFVGYLKPMITSVLYCVLEPLAASINPINDHWLLRDYGARLLGFVIEKYGNKNKEVVDFMTDSIKNILSDPTRPLCSHYGAIVTINAFGIGAVRSLLCPNLLDYYQTSLRIIEEETDSNNAHLKEDAHKVVGVILQSLEKLLLSGVTDPEDMRKYTEITSLFGDSLTSRLPLCAEKYLPKYRDIQRMSKRIQDVSQNSVYFGPAIQKSTVRPKKRARSASRSEIFLPGRFSRAKITIDLTLGKTSRSSKMDTSYTDTDFCTLSNKTSQIGKAKCLLKKITRQSFCDYLSLTL